MLPVAAQARRFPRLLVGLVLFGVGLGLVIQGDYGLPGWDVLHQGLSEQLPISIGVAVISVGAILLIVMVVLHEPIGIGTVANVVVIGLAIDTTLAIVEQPSGTAIRILFTLGGPFVVALGSGLYLGVRLGPGTRDGLMTALNKRGVTLWKARFGIELVATLGGIALGGTVGWGTVWFLVVIGPSVQFAIDRLSVPVAPGERFADKRSQATAAT